MAAADRHKNPLVVGIRGADERLRDEARAAAVAAGYPDLSAATVAYWSWLTRRSGAGSRRSSSQPAMNARRIGSVSWKLCRSPKVNTCPVTGQR